MKPIVESKMTFGPYPEGHCFYIEKSRCYTTIREHIRIAEFLLLRAKGDKQVMWVVEVKSSTPRPETQPNFDVFITEIQEKLINAFSLGWAACMGRHPHAKAELPAAFKALDLAQTDVKFVLVIHGQKEEWLPPIQDALVIALRATIKTWAFAPTSVAVINEALARQYGLITSETGS